MASIVDDPNGRKRIQFVAGDGRRKPIRLGKVTTKQAEAFKVKVEALIGQMITGVADDEVSRWRAPKPSTTRVASAACCGCSPSSESTS